jgi:hypothetical protein
MKMPVVWREVVSIQRNFLWGGLSTRRRINWVKWADICKTKKEGGLGIKDLCLMNLSLLAKWRWRLLSEEDAVWINVIKAKYGVETTINTRLVEVGAVAMASPWW